MNLWHAADGIRHAVEVVGGPSGTVNVANESWLRFGDAGNMTRSWVGVRVVTVM